MSEYQKAINNVVYKLKYKYSDIILVKMLNIHHNKKFDTTLFDNSQS